MWLSIAIIGYFCLALANLGDKLLITRAVKNPIVYAFFTGLLGLVAFALAPFGLNWPGFYQFSICIVTGIVYLIALILFFHSLSIAEASRVIPLIGGLSPIFVFILSYFFLGERLVGYELGAFAILVAGGVLISYETRETTGFPKKVIPVAILAAFMFASFYVLSKFIYIHQSFISGFVWMRLGGFLVALTFLSKNRYRRAIIKSVSGQVKTITNKIKLLYLGNQGLGALGFILTNYAIALASVTLVNAMQGLQYVFVLILAIFIVKKFPQLLREKITGQILARKILAIGFIVVGLILLYI